MQTYRKSSYIQINIRKGGASIERPDKNKVFIFERRITRASRARLKRLLKSLEARGYHIYGGWQFFDRAHASANVELPLCP